MLHKRPLKILGIYLGVYPIYLGFISGGERVFIELLRRCKTHKVTVITSKTGVKILGVNSIIAKTYVISVPFENILCRSLIGFAFVLLMRLIRSVFIALRLTDNFDIIYPSSHFLFDVLPAILFSRGENNAKIIVHLHHLEPPPLRRAKHHPLIPSIAMWISQSFSLALIRRYAHIVFANPHEEEVIKNLLKGKRVETFLRGVDIKRINEVREAIRGYDACFLGRLAPLKGVFDLIDVWKNVCVSLPDAKLAIIGTGLEKDVSMLRIKLNQIEKNVILLGAVSEDEKYATLKASKIFTFPSYEEGFGIAVLEAMACGLPVVAYNLPAYEVFGNDAIIKVPVGDKRAFSKAVLNLLLDEELRRKMSERAKAVASQFDWDKVLKRELEKTFSA